ncbi:MAG: chloride channel protein [Deltaproteobacteria bacterium]|nr:chloride channel protein [Deltaproteobacteria bacterium]
MVSKNPLFRILGDLVRSYRSVLRTRWLVLGILAGILSGAGAVLFFAGVEWLRYLLMNVAAGVDIPAPAGESFHAGPVGDVFRPWLIPVMLGAVGVVTGLLVSRFVPETRHSGTDGTDGMIGVFHRHDGMIRPQVPLIRVATAILTIGAGGSAGREGPISLLGAGLGSWLAQKFGLSARERRILLLAGAAGGLGAIFKAPLGGALTAVEVIYREDFEAEAILPAVLSSVTAYSIFTLVYGTEPIFGIAPFRFTDLRELPVYIVLAAFCSLTGWIYVRTFSFIKYKVFWPLTDRLGMVWAMGLGGLTMGLLGMLFPQLLCGGYGWLEMAILGKISVAAMLGILLGKTLATSVTLGSGLSGGMFAPALFVGGMSGGVVGFTAHNLFPNVVTQPGGYVLVGMGAFFAGVANAPIGPLIMVCELTQGYGLLAPLMLASAVCLILNRNVSLYENQVNDKFDSPAHAEDATVNVLEGLQVEDYYRPGRVTTLEEGTTFKAMTDIVANANELYFPVRDDRGHITGIVAVLDLRRVLFEDSLRDLILARDVARKPVLLRPDDTLYTALLKFVDSDFGQIPVVDPEDQDRILGLLAREDVFNAYALTLRSLRGEGG